MFVRELNPYGFAVKTNKALGYTSEEFIEFYTQCLDYIIELNRKGKCFSESSAAMILSKLLTPWPIGFVDLQSPTGSGFGVTLYNYDGDVYASDESRMLAETGDTTFRLGNVLDDGYEALFFGETMQLLASAACNESLPGCSDCAYQSFCGADPVRNYATQDDVIGNRAEGNGFCKKYMALIKHLLALHQNADDDLTRILWSWINRDDHERMKLKEEQS
jgi:sulfatase maturation enzyme AslB (radical SAM superfamily)